MVATPVILPVTTPEVETVAIFVFEDDHKPPFVELVRFDVPKIVTILLPEISTAGNAFTTIFIVSVQPVLAVQINL
jgi:hypothetical protein